MTTPTPTARPARGVIPLIVAIVGVALVPVSFVLGLDAAFSGNGTGASIFTVLFFTGLAMALVALVVAIVLLVRGAGKVLPIATIIVALLPFAGVLALYLVNVTA